MRSNLYLVVLGLFMTGILVSPSRARDLRINIPKRSDATPVQKLNRDGVKEIQKHHLEKAQRIFYRAYLMDPDDPFTLNNLGYISELQGKVERAQRYYELAAKENNSETVIAEATERKLQGKKLSEVTGAYANLDLQINRGNIQAMALLQQGRSQEAEDGLRNTLKLNPRNPFTLNNLGYAMEMQGDLESALQYYNQASISHSTDPVIVAIDSRWRGKPISDIAFSNEQAVRQRLQSEGSQQAKAARLNVEGVSALNHNNSQRAEDYFRQAYQLDPQNAFSLNNMGFLAEAQGDPETAADFYSRARIGEQAGTAVSAASHHEMVGEVVGQVAGTNTQAAEAVLQASAEAKRRNRTPVVLRHRDNSPVTAPAPDSISPSGNPAVPRPPIDNAPVENTTPPQQR
jgi:Flp pilus assembly protein TadD